MSEILDESSIKTIVKDVYYNRCGHSEKRSYEIDINNFDSFDRYIQDSKGIDDICSQCKAFDRKYHMVRKVYDGDYDQTTKTYFFKTDNMEEVERYCNKRDILLEDEYYPINSMYDCTGKVFHIAVRTWRKMGYIVVRNTAYKDL